MKFSRSVTSRSIAAVIIGIVAVLGAVAVTPTVRQAIDGNKASTQKYEEHRFSGSSSSVDAFQAWFDGGDFVEPTVETLDLRELKVNDTQVAHAGDIIDKDEDGNFWVK